MKSIDKYAIQSYHFLVKNLFVCYSREDYEFIASFELEFMAAVKAEPNIEIKLKIDKSAQVIRLGDRYKDSIEKAIKNSDGAIIFVSKNSSSNSAISLKSAWVVAITIC